MAFGSFNDGQGMAPMADINVTPMVDVMLVLLVIFIMAAPFMTHAIKLDLPRTQAGAQAGARVSVTLSLNQDGQVFWNEEQTPVSQPQLQQRLGQLAIDAPATEIELRADRATRYEAIASVMADAQAQGLHKLSFLTTPGAAKDTSQQESRHGQGHP